MKQIQDGAAFLFITAVGVLSLVSILGVWDFFNHDVITKSFETLGLLAIVSIVVIIASRFIEARQQGANTPVVLPSPAFPLIRRSTLGVLIVAAALLALLGVLAIWDVIADKDVVYKSLGSLAVLVFGAFIIVMTCLEREGGEDNKQSSSTPVSMIIVSLVVVSLLYWAFNGLFW